MFVTHCDIPYKVKDYTLKHYVTQIRNRFLNVLAETYGVDTSDEALRKAVAEHNEVCKIITEIGDMRKLENPPITGYEFHVLNLVTYCCPKSKILPYLKETLAEIKKRKVDAKPWYRCRVALRDRRPRHDPHGRRRRRDDRRRPFLLRQHSGP